MNEKSLRHDVKLKYHSTGLYIERIFRIITWQQYVIAEYSHHMIHVFVLYESAVVDCMMTNL